MMERLSPEFPLDTVVKEYRMRFVPGSRVAAICTALALLAGCGGGGAASGGLGGSTIPKQTNGATSAVRFAITVPQKTAATGRGPAYVSPATQSMTIAVLQGATNVLSQTVGLTPSSPGCTNSLASTLCTISLSLAAGSYTASITTYDGPNGTGNALSTAQSVAFTVTANQSNLVPLTLSGIPTALKVLSAGTNAVDVLAQDADGNYIVGAGAPTFTASASSGPAVATIVQPTASNPNRVAFVQASPVVPGTESFSITASYPAGESNACTQTGAVCTVASAVTATASAPMAVTANYGGDVLGYTLPFTSAAQTPTTSVALTNADYLAEDSSGNVFAASYAVSTTLLEIPAPYTAATVTNTLGGDNAEQIAVAPNGDVALANTSGSAGGSLYTPPYTGAPTAISNGLSAGSFAVAFDASNNAYFCNYSTTGTVSAFAPPYTGAPAAVVGLTSGCAGLTVSGSMLFVGESADVDIFSLPMTSSSTPIATLSNGISDVNRSAIDASGNLWVSNYNGGLSRKGSIEEFTKPFSTGEAPAVTINMPVGTSTSYDTWGIAFDSSGNLYVTNSFGGAANGGLLEFTPPITSASTPAVAIETANFNDLYDLVITPSALSVTP